MTFSSQDHLLNLGTGERAPVVLRRVGGSRRGVVELLLDAGAVAANRGVDERHRVVAREAPPLPGREVRALREREAARALPKERIEY